MVFINHFAILTALVAVINPIVSAGLSLDPNQQYTLNVVRFEIRHSPIYIPQYSTNRRR
ncbi:hypothetical protein BGZ63DRAFT_387692 [Mariannaea sp. PMI_226]|nr:hypothetical protein BGZ63DRAFT_387692 [Mariannaea sp. PMI_226]